MTESQPQQPVSPKGPSKFKTIVYAVLAVLVAGMGWVAFGGKISSSSISAIEMSDEQKERYDLEGAPEEINKFFRLFSLLRPTHEAAIETVRETWQPGYETRLIEIFPMLFPDRQEALASLLKEKTGQDFGTDITKWQQWCWGRDYAPDAEFAKFKHYLHRREDSRFGDHFNKDFPAEIRLDEIRWGGVSRDGIPPLSNAKTLSVEEADYLDDSNVVFGVVLNGDARCYPKRILAWHEMFKDTIGGDSVCGVYCTLCGALIIYQTEFDGQHHELGTSGFLYRSNKLMYDEETKSLWSTFTGEPVVGELAGKGIQLDRHYVVTTTWGEWKQRHPDTKVLSLETGHIRNYDEGVAYRDYFGNDELMFDVPKLDDRLMNKAEVFALREQDDQLAISIDYLKSKGIHTDKIGELKFVVLSNEDGTSRAYSTGDTSFKEFNGTDSVTDADGETWKVSEKALTLGDKSLNRIPSHRAFWFGWYAQFPETRLIK